MVAAGFTVPCGCGDATGSRQGGQGGGLNTFSGTETNSVSNSDSEFDTEESGSGSVSGTESGGGASPNFDIGAPVGEGDCSNGGGGGMSAEFSYIWIVNTGDTPPTVSKVNTQTLVEEGRYMTRDDGAGNPSRTSVALSGNAAVANRAGGITKYFAHDCPPGPTSAGGQGSELAWGMDACIAWSTNMPYSKQRPVAWTPGTWSEETCSYEEEFVWTTGANDGFDVVALLLDGADGSILDTIPIPAVDGGGWGPYGGAVDSDGNFWFSQLWKDGNMLVKVDFITRLHTVFTHEVEAYGMSVDSKGRPWICGRGTEGRLARLTPATGVWDYSATGELRFGCMPDNDHMWVGSKTNHLQAVDLETMLPAGPPIALGLDSEDIHGTSIDFEGYVWGVSRGTEAARYDPATGSIDIVRGLNSPYTYSDMTGFALANAGGPQG